METSTINETTSFGIDSTTTEISSIIESSILPAVETVVSEPATESAITKTIQNATLSTLLRIVVTGQLSSLSVPLDKTTTIILLELLENTPKTFDHIQESVQIIAQDGKINTSDIPQLLKLVTELYPLVKHTKIRPSSLDGAKIVGTIVKVVIHVLVNEQKIKVSNPVQFLNELDRVLDTAVELLSFTKSIKKSRNCSKLFRFA
jgi:hypothetical protein